MGYFQAVRSGAKISMSIADLLEDAAPEFYSGANRTKTIREVNDTLHGRSDVSIDMLYDLLEQKCGAYDTGRVEKIKQDIEAFHRQKLCRTLRYTQMGGQEYRYPAQVLRRDLRQQLGEFQRMYLENYAVQRFKEGMQK